MRRRILRFGLVTVLGLLGTVVGTFIAVFLTPAGRGLAGRALSERVDQLVRGDVEVGAVGGTLLTGLELDQLIIRDTSGEVMADIPHLEVRYRLPELLAGRIVLQRLTLDHPVLHLIKHRDGRMNYEEVFRLGEGTGTGAGTLVRFERVRIVDGTVLLDLPWSPPDSMRTPDRARRALLIDRSQPGRIIEPGPEGYARRIRFEHLTARFPLMRLGTPDHLPVQLLVDTLATRVSDPAVTLTDLNGSVEIEGTTLAFRLTRAGLPHSTFAGDGRIFWPTGPVLYDFRLDGKTLSLADLRWISADFPDLTGHAQITARSRGATRTDYALDDLSLGGAMGRLDGKVTAVADERRGLGVDGMNLTLHAVDLDVLRPYLDTIPFQGRVTGTVVGGGFLDSLDVDFDWTFHDTRVPGGADSHLSAVGHLAFGGPEGTRFDTLTLRDADLDLRTVRLVAPAVALQGRLHAEGTLAGPWTDLTFDGTAVHQDGATPASTVQGRVRLDTRTSTTAFAGVLDLEPLLFDGLRRSFPGLTAQGALRGRVALDGTAEHIRVDADVTGDLGHLRAVGAFGVQGGGWNADSLALVFQDLDTRAVIGRGPSTALTGTAFVDGNADSAAAPRGSGRLQLASGQVGGFVFDTVMATVAADSGRLTFDTLAFGWAGGVIGGKGTIGWAGPDDGRLVLAATVKDLRPLDSLLLAVGGWTRDTSPELRPLSGAAAGTVTLRGSLDSLSADGALKVTDLLFQSLHVPAASANFVWNGGRRGAVRGELTSDTLEWNGIGFTGNDVAVVGFADSLGWRVATQPGPVDTVRAGGAWRRLDAGASRLDIDSLRAQFTAHAWRLAGPSVVTLGDSGIGVDSLRLIADDGAGELRLSGTTPGIRSGEIHLRARDLDLRDLAGLFARDTLGLVGEVSADLALGGTAAAPTLHGTASLADGGFGKFRGPYVQGVVDYADRRLDLNLLLWKTGRPILAAEAHLPVDLALVGGTKRLVDGPLDLRVHADSADLAMLEAFTRNVRQIRGGLTADAGVEGTWAEPRLTGFLQIKNGAASLPALGVRYDGVNGAARLSGDTISLDSLSLRSGGGTLAVGGTVRLERLTRPILDLDLNASGFRVMDVRNYLTLVTSGRLKLTGPVFGATLGGRITADQGALYFADLVTKQVVDLSDPATAALIDTALVRDADLGPSIENRFLDSLTISGFRLAVGDEFWLRSTEANIRLTGEVGVGKTARNYRLDGTLKADRGNYALKIGFITRPFTVQSGTVRFLGTPDLNAELDLQAVHTVHPSDGSADVPVVAHITGTTLAPKLALSSPLNPTFSETELVSYLMFGRPSFALDATTATGQGGGEQAALQTGLAYLSSALSSEIERTLVSDLGVPVDFVEIRPGGAGGSFVNSSAGLTTLSAGWRIGPRTFFTFNAGLCPNLGQLSYRSFGASIEQRFTPMVRAQASVEPVRTCTPTTATDVLGTTNQYQLGFDLLWEREY